MLTEWVLGGMNSKNCFIK